MQQQNIKCWYPEEPDDFSLHAITMQNKIIIKGAREHILKNINLELPRDPSTLFRIARQIFF